jgi:hypothetical protein
MTNIAQPGPPPLLPQRQTQTTTKSLPIALYAHHPVPLNCRTCMHGPSFKKHPSGGCPHLRCRSCLLTAAATKCSLTSPNHPSTTRTIPTSPSSASKVACAHTTTPLQPHRLRTTAPLAHKNHNRTRMSHDYNNLSTAFAPQATTTCTSNRGNKYLEVCRLKIERSPTIAKSSTDEIGES